MNYASPIVRRLLALLLSLTLLLPAGAAGASVVFCKMTQRARAECCCEKAFEAERTKARRGTEGRQTLEQSGCCERTSLPASAERSGTTSAHDSVSVLSAPVLAILPASIWIEQLARDYARAPANARAPPRAPRPLFILNRSYLS